MTQGGQIQIDPQYLVQALRADNAGLREHNTNLQALVLQIQDQSNGVIAGLQSQLKSLQDAETERQKVAAEPLPGEVAFSEDEPASTTGE